jgi:hypothetical protein
MSVSSDKSANRQCVVLTITENCNLDGSVAKFVFDEFFVFYVIDFIVLGFSFLPQKLNFATEPYSPMGGL